jgi:hypothetical protein
MIQRENSKKINIWKYIKPNISVLGHIAILFSATLIFLLSYVTFGANWWQKRKPYYPFYYQKSYDTLLYEIDRDQKICLAYNKFAYKNIKNDCKLGYTFQKYGEFAIADAQIRILKDWI